MANANQALCGLIVGILNVVLRLLSSGRRTAHSSVGVYRPCGVGKTQRASPDRDHAVDGSTAGANARRGDGHVPIWILEAARWWRTCRDRRKAAASLAIRL